MGEDKALLPFGDFTSLSWFQHHKLSQFFKEVFISAKEDKFDFPTVVISDTLPISSPLVGLISVFETLDVEKVFVLSVDTPLLDKTTIDTLVRCQDYPFDAIIANSPKGLEPLCGIYKRSILPYAYKHLKDNNHKLTSLLESMKTKKLFFEHQEIFTNLNYYEEYAQLIKTKLENH